MPSGNKLNLHISVLVDVTVLEEALELRKLV
jgi:hypothetical protein